MDILKKTYSKNNNEIILISGGICAERQIPPQQKTILIIGVVHGDEPQGKFLIENYLQWWDSNPTLQPPRPLREREVFQHEERVLEKRVRGILVS